MGLREDEVVLRNVQQRAALYFILRGQGRARLGSSLITPL
jgi:hypothetical protein